MNRAGRAGTLNVRILGYAGGHPVDARDQQRPAQRLAVRRPAAARRGQALRRRRARIARGVAQGALSRQARHARAQPDQRRRTGEAGRRSGCERAPAGDPRDRRCRQCAGHQRVRTTWPAAIRATAAGGSSMRRCVDVADLPRLAQANIIASMQPTHQTSDRTMAEARLGPQRLGGAYAWQTLARSGVRLAFGSDFPVESPNPFPGLAAAVSRQDLSGQPAGGWRPQERVSFAAGAGRLHARRGLCGVRRAEDRQPRAGQACRLHPRRPRRQQPSPRPTSDATQVLETWVAGRKVWQRAAVSGGRGERGR